MTSLIRSGAVLAALAIAAAPAAAQKQTPPPVSPRFLTMMS